VLLELKKATMEALKFFLFFGFDVSTSTFDPDLLSHLWVPLSLPKLTHPNK